MKKLVIALVAACALSFAGCSTAVGAKAAEAHKAVFGCWPQGYTPPRVLEAQGPKKDAPKKDFLGNECGKPVYRHPSCSEPVCPDCQPVK